MASVIRGDDNFDSGDYPQSTDLAAVGTHVFARYASSGSSFQTAGSTHAGSNLRYSASERDQGDYINVGTWRLMGYAVYRDRPSVLVRIL